MSGLTTLFAADHIAASLAASFSLQAPPPPGGSAGGTFSMVFMLLGLILIFYFLMWRPESKRYQAHQRMVSALKKGDEVILLNGIYGKVHEISGNQVVLEIARDVRIRVVPDAISGLAPQPKAEASGEADKSDKADKDKK